MDRVELVIVLDRSGSMEMRRADHEGGLRSFIRDQRALAGDVRLTLVQFDSQEPFELVYDGAPLADVDEERVALVPRGGTPLLDAVGLTLLHVTGRLADAAEKPGMTVVMIITDGQENASRKFTLAEVKRLVTEREAAGWKVLYLGANVDAFHEAAQIGVAYATTMNYAATPEAVRSMYTTLASGTACARRLLQGDATLDQVYAAYAFTPEQRTAAQAGGEEGKP